MKWLPLNRLLIGLILCLCSRNLCFGQVFPQVVVGQVGDGTYYRSTISILGQNPASRLSPFACTLQFQGMTPTILGLGTNTQFQFTVPSVGWLYLVTDTSGPLQTGYADLTCNATYGVYAYVQYSFYNSSGGTIGEATVSPSPPTSTTRFIADQTGNARVGVAMANTGGLPLAFTITAVDQSGVSVSGPTFVVPAQTAVAKFVDQLIPTGTDGKVLQVTITTSANFFPVALRYTGTVFSTIPCTSN
jgi:hypothetical protein